MMESITTTKKCSVCGRELPREEFHKSARSRDGLMPFCKDCHLKSARKGGRRKKTESVSPVSQPKQPIQEQKPTTDTSAEVKAIRALEKVYGCEEIGRWLEMNNSYKLFLKYFKAE